MSQEKHIRKSSSLVEAFKKDAPGWWKQAVELFKKDKRGPVDEDDPEYDAQKIYMHWIESYKSR